MQNPSDYNPPYKITGDHPTLSRPDEILNDYHQAVDYAQTLIRSGYENVKITDSVGPGLPVEFPRPAYLTVPTSELADEIFLRGDSLKVIGLLQVSLGISLFEQAPPMPTEVHEWIQNEMAKKQLKAVFGDQPT